MTKLKKHMDAEKLIIGQLTMMTGLIFYRVVQIVSGEPATETEKAIIAVALDVPVDKIF